MRGTTNKLRANIGLLPIVIGLVLLLVRSSAVGQEKELPPAAKVTIDFAKHIEPILKRRCHRCHGPKKQESKFRLDSRAAALKGGEMGRPIVVGKSASSKLIQFVAGIDEDIRMPPSGRRLTAEEVGLFRAWIDQGLKWPGSPAEPVEEKPAETQGPERSEELVKANNEAAERIEAAGGRVERGRDDPNRPLVKVSFRGPKTADSSLTSLQGLNDVKTLQIVATEISDAGLEQVGGLNSLEELDLSFNAITGSGLGRLNGLTNLRSLKLYRTKITDDCLEHLSALSDLETLVLHGNGITGAGLEHIKGLSKLETLDLYATPVTDSDLVHLKALGLRTLNLVGTAVGDDGLEHLKDLASLQELSLSYTGITDAGLARLSGLENLEQLALSGTRVGDAGLKHLGGLSKLRALALSGTTVSNAGLQHLEKLANLQRLDLRDTAVTEEGVEGLKKALPKVWVHR